MLSGEETLQRGGGSDYVDGVWRGVVFSACIRVC